MDGRATNWAGNVSLRAPDRPPRLAGRAAPAGRRQRPHPRLVSPLTNCIAHSAGDLVSVAGLPPAIALDLDRSSVTVAAGVRRRAGRAPAPNRPRAAQPARRRHRRRAADRHCSGDGNGSLSTAVRGLEMVTADGDLVTLSRDVDGDELDGAVVGGRWAAWVVNQPDAGRGAGVRRPAVRLRRPAPRPAGRALRRGLASAYSVSLFTGWGGGRIDQVWQKRLNCWTPARRSRAGWGARLAATSRHPVPGRSGEAARSSWAIRSLAPAAAAPSAPVDPERGGGAATGVPGAAATRVEALAAIDPDRRAGHARAAGLRGPHSGGGRAVAEPELPTRQRGAALHLGQGPGGRDAGAGRGRGRAGAVRRPAALGEAVRRRPGRLARGYERPARTFGG